MNKLLNQELFLEKYHINQESFAKTGLEWTDLNEIYIHYKKQIPALETSAIYLFNSLMKTPQVHSVRYRIKDAEHVIEKIIRKRIKTPEQEITIDNYTSELTDLIGLRALHLFKEEWLPIHELISTTWDFHEPPTGYYRAGDTVEYKKRFEEIGLETKEHPYGYRSIHYVIITKPAKKEYFAEIQVRTIFEEAWSEIDHKVRYPYDQDNLLFGQFLLILNRLAGSADEMGTYIKFLKKEIQAKEETYKKAILEKDKLIEELEKKTKNLPLEELDLKFLTDGLEQLKAQPLKMEDFKLPDLSFLSNIATIKLPDFSFLTNISDTIIPEIGDFSTNDNAKAEKVIARPTIKKKHRN